MYSSPPMPTMRPNGDTQGSQGGTPYQPINSQYHMPVGVHPPMLPPISSIEPTGPRPQHDNVSSVRHQYPRHFSKQTSVPIGSGAGKRPLAISTATSADSSDVEEDGGELPAQGLVAPLEVLRGLADVALQRAAKASRRYPVYDLFRSCVCRKTVKQASLKVALDRPPPIPDPTGQTRNGRPVIHLVSSSPTVSSMS